MKKTAEQMYFEQENKQRLEAEALQKLKEDAMRAQMELAKQNWAQRHYIRWALISALIGGIITYIIDKVAPLLLSFLQSHL